jgi:hypothetical protein
MNKLMLGTALMLGAFSLGNAAQNQTEPQHNMGPHNMGPMLQMMQNCPMKVEGVKVAVADTTNGIAVTITTESGNVGELRRRVELMATMHSPNGDKPAMMRNRMIAGAAKFEEVENGARLTLTPKDPAQLEAFRKQVREHAQRMEKGDCSMMQGMMGGIQQQESAPPEYGHDSHHPQ